MDVIALVIGGFIGTILRYGLGNIIPASPDGFPLGILLINLAGCFFLGWFFTGATLRWRLRPEIRLGLGTGVTGAFTTFSTFSVQSVDLIQSAHYVAAAIYVLLSVVGGLILTFAGSKLAASQRKGQTS
ncbi:fluoride efflux transporter CrcB [Paenibacillus thalictri]|uniref:Fluoride-specific ion channel FluC n=1 Tax=Paenibacillus thalictri TaxID=2527873 RepID=A0A4Q9DQR8_9BACL|nr:fluoride efflux transporter CrcB [Paenibacillus thalictri]TBL78977.1 fluoride efflux transporter CrcB [Paenibacillus thalictri]